MAADTPLAILDEPTSALDAETESEVLEALGGLMRGRTTLLIAVAIDLIWRRDTRLETVRTSWLTDKHVVAGRWAAYTFMFWMVIVGLANRAGVEQFIYFQF